MAINLEEHAIFIDRLKMDMVPLSIAKQAVEEAVKYNEELDNAIEAMQKAFENVNANTKDLND